MEKSLIEKNTLIALLANSTHGKLDPFIVPVQRMTVEDPDFMAHLIAWNAKEGQMRDPKVALPAISLSRPNFVFVDNSLAHLALLSPRDLVRALRFAKGLKTPTHGKKIMRLVEDYLRFRESQPQIMEGAIIQHRTSMKTLYGMYHIKPSAFVDKVLMKGEYPRGSVFEKIARLKDMTDTEAAATIVKHKVPWLIASSSLGEKLKSTPVLAALIDNMTASELVTNTKMLEKLGIKTVPELRAAFQAGLGRVAESKQNTFKTTKAAEQVTDKALKQKLLGAQEKQIDSLKKLQGDWLVLADKSGSMTKAIDTSRQIAATLARVAGEKVHLIFFDGSPRYLDVSGKSYDEIVTLTKGITAGGSTCIGTAMQYASEKGLSIHGIALVSDGGEGGYPVFAEAYKRHCDRTQSQPPVYFYKLDGDTDRVSGNMNQFGQSMETFDLRCQKVDMYSLPNLIQTMRVSRFSLIDAILETPLLTLDQVFQAGGKNASAAISKAA